MEDKLYFLEEERQKLWDRIGKLEETVSKKTSDYSKEAQQASKKTSEYRNRSLDAKAAAEKHLEDLKLISEEIISIKEEARKLTTVIKRFSTNAEKNSEQIESDLESITTKKIKLDKQVAEINTVFQDYTSLEEKVTKITNAAAKADDESSKISSIHKQLITRKKEIDELFYEVFGYDDEDEEGNPIRVDGLKDNLNETYEELISSIESSKKDIQDFFDNFTLKLEDIENNQKQDFDNNLKNWKDEYDGIKKKIEYLLPNAMTAGLSHAYSSKKEAEEKEIKQRRIGFYAGLIGLVLVSFIPFWVSLELMKEGKEILDVILDIPRIVLAILPIYIPVFWLAYSSNIKLKLSKRLVEEYTHKEVLSKTFEGLSKRVDDIEDEKISEELRIRLLFNILDVSSENPGKLISDYKKSDHPLMDALDKSEKLSRSITNLSKIPGIGRLTKILEKKQESLIQQKVSNVESTLDAILDNENDRDEVIET